MASTLGESKMISMYTISSGEWEHWINRVEEYIYPSDSKPEYSSILVPNVDNVCMDFLVNTIAKQGKVRNAIYSKMFTHFTLPR